MKRYEAYIEKLSKKFELNPEVTGLIYKEIHSYDWKIFRSYMADDRDHPEERDQAKRDLLAFRDMLGEDGLKVKFDNIKKFMEDDEEYNIHKMKEEIEG